MAANSTESDVEEFSYSSSSDDDLVGVGGVVQPYQHEPMLADKEEESDSSETEDGDQDRGERIGNTEWCECGNYEVMGTDTESLCCLEVAPVVHRLEREGKPCVVDLDGFMANCLNIDVLEASFYEFPALEHGPLGDDEEIHKMYRHVAYRRFTRYIWKLLGKKNRKVIPACAVCAIRRRFPSEAYTNFQYPRP